MKSLQFKDLILICILFISTSVFSQNSKIQSRVDERTELLSIVFRLAGAEEYSQGRLPDYNYDIDKYFGPYKLHKVVKQAKKVHFIQHVAYEAVMNMAIHIEITDGNIILLKDVADESISDRWNKKTIETFIEELNDFYKLTNFNKFFKQHEQLYNIAEKRFDSILQKVNFEWFNEFNGGSPRDNFNLVLNMSNAGSNYGPKVIYKNDNEQFYAIIGTWYIDSLKNPVYYEDVIPTIIHEFSHSFCNHLVNDRSECLKNAGEIIYAKVKRQMNKYSYGSAKTMLCEALVRASVLKYLAANDTNKLQLKREIATDQGKGFIWIDKFTDKLSYYEQNRVQYRTLESFMPDIVIFYDSLAMSFDSFFENYYTQCPKLISSSIENKSKVTVNLNEIILKFDRPMQSLDSICVTYRSRDLSFPKITNKEWLDNKTLKLNFILDAATKYSIALPKTWYISETNYPMAEHFELMFSTE